MSDHERLINPPENARVCAIPQEYLEICKEKRERKRKDKDGNSVTDVYYQTNECAAAILYNLERFTIWKMKTYAHCTTTDNTWVDMTQAQFEEYELMGAWSTSRIRAGLELLIKRGYIQRGRAKKQEKRTFKYRFMKKKVQAAVSQLPAMFNIEQWKAKHYTKDAEILVDETVNIAEVTHSPTHSPSHSKVSNDSAPAAFAAPQAAPDEPNLIAARDYAGMAINVGDVVRLRYDLPMQPDGEFVNDGEYGIVKDLQLNKALEFVVTVEFGTGRVLTANTRLFEVERPMYRIGQAVNIYERSSRGQVGAMEHRDGWWHYEVITDDGDTFVERESELAPDEPETPQPSYAVGDAVVLNRDHIGLEPVACRIIADATWHIAADDWWYHIASDEQPALTHACERHLTPADPPAPPEPPAETKKRTRKKAAPKAAKPDKPAKPEYWGDFLVEVSEAFNEPIGKAVKIAEQMLGAAPKGDRADHNCSPPAELGEPEKFVKWYKRGHQGCDLPTSAEALESWWHKFKQTKTRTTQQFAPAGDFAPPSLKPTVTRRETKVPA